MPQSETGANTCDVCGSDIDNAGIDRCATVTYYGEDGRIYNLRLCSTSRDGSPAGCAGNRVTAQSFPQVADLVKPRPYTPPPAPVVPSGDDPEPTDTGK